MKTTEVNKELIGKKVSFIFTGLESTGTVTDIINNVYAAGLVIKFDHPIQWGDDFYTESEFTARKPKDVIQNGKFICHITEFGALSNVKLI